MRKSFIKHILCLLGAVLVFAGCYRDELADIHNQIDDLDLRTIRQQIEGMKEGVANLQELQKWIEPAVENLQASKKAIEAEIEDLKARLAEAGAATEGLKDELAFKEAQLGNLEKTIAGLESVSAALVERVKELEAAVKAPTTGLSDRVAALETAWQGMVTQEELAALEKYATEFSGDFGDNFFKSLEECKQQLSQWVSESTAIQQMFDKYYDCAYLDAEINGLNGVDGTQDASLAEIGTAVSGLKAELQKMINDAINGVADRYESSLEEIENAIKVIQNDIADQYALLWAKIGREDLAIEGTIVSVINTLIERFGTLDGKTGDIDAIVSALRTDLDLFRSDFLKALASETETYNGETLAGLHKLLNDLQDIVNGKADNTKVDSLIEEAKKLTAGVQTALEKYIAENNAALEAYLKKAEQDYLTNAEAEKLKESFALISNLSKLDASITGFDTGEGAFIERGEWDSTVMGLLSKLNSLVGIGEDGAADKPKQGWTNTIVEAVNDLYVLVNGKLNEDEATEVAIGIVNGFINELLGVKEGGTAKQVKDLLEGFADSINKLGTSIGTLDEKIGDISKFQDTQDKDIAAAIANIKSSIADIKSVLAGISGKYADKEHGHDGKDITDLAEAISREIDAITGKLADLKTKAKETLVAAINELHDKFGDYYGKTGNEGVDALLSDLEAVLAAAVRDGGAGLEGYFATLNLSALRSAIDDVIKADTGTIDTRVKAAIDALNLTQYLKDSGLAAYDYVSKNETDVKANLEILSALAALKVTIGEDVLFEYGDLDDAIKAVYDALSGHITEYGELSGTYTTIDSRLSAVEDMIGEGFSASNTISSVLGTIAGTADSLDGLFDGLGANQSVKSLADELRGLFNALINALVGKTSGGSVSDIDSSNNLIALKASLDAIGFNTIRGKLEEGGEELSLAEVLGGITNRIGALETTMGTGSLGTGKNVIDELKRLSDALGSFKNSEYSQWTDGIDKEIQDILDRLVGDNGAEISDLKALMDSLDELQDRFDKFQNVTGNNFEKVINDLCDNLSDLQLAVGKSDIFGDDFKNIADEIVAVRKYVDNFKIDLTSLGGIFKIIEEAVNYAVCIARINNYKAGTGIYTDNGYSIFDIVGFGRYTDPDLGLLNTTDKSDFVSAVNELFDLLAPFDVALEKLNSMKEAVIGGGNYLSLKAIAAVFASLKYEIGSKTADFDAADIYEAIQALDITASSLADMLGENKTDYPDVWTAVNDLRAQLAARSINSLVYIPEYDDGKATAVSDGSVFTVDMDFRVNAPASLSDVLSAGKLPVKGLLKTPGAGVGTEINGNATYSDGILSVSLFGAKSISDGSSIAVVLGSVANGIMSQYIPIHISDSMTKIARIKSADPASGTVFKFLAGIGGSRSIKFTPENELDDLSDITVNESINNIDVKGNGLVWTIEASSNISTRNTGKIYFPDDFTYTVEVSSVRSIMSLTDAAVATYGSTYYFNVRYNKTVTIDFGDLSQYGLSGSLSATVSDYSGYSNFVDSSSVRVEGSKVIFNTLSTRNGRSRITVKKGDSTLLDGIAVVSLNY